MLRLLLALRFLYNEHGYIHWFSIFVDNTELETTIITPYMAEPINVTVGNVTGLDRTTMTIEEAEIVPTNVTVTYSLWVGSNVSEKYSINITVDRNETFYEIMQKAAVMDPKYTWEIL